MLGYKGMYDRHFLMSDGGARFQLLYIYSIYPKFKDTGLDLQGHTYENRED